MSRNQFLLSAIPLIVVVVVLIQQLPTQRKLRHELSSRDVFPGQFFTIQKETSIPCIDQTFVIHLKHRHDRMKFMSHQLQRLMIPFTAFLGVNFLNGSNTDVIQRFHPSTKFNFSLVSEEIMKRGAPWLNWGSTGCWQSHLQLYFEIASGNFSKNPGPFLILEEDDVVVTGRTLQILSKYYLNRVLPSDWEVLYLMHKNLTCHDKNLTTWTTPPGKDPYMEYCQVKFAWSLGAYVLRSSEVAEKLIAVGNTPHVQVADWYVNYLYHNSLVKAYAVIKAPVHHHGGFNSSIRIRENPS